MTSGEWDQEDIEWFWQTIESAGQDRERLRKLLMSFSKEEVYRFQDIFIEMAVELRDEPYTYYVSPGESEDGVEDISHSVVSRGRSAYEAVISEPSRMPAEVAMDDPTNLYPVAFEVYFKRFGEPLDLM